MASSSHQLWCWVCFLCVAVPFHVFGVTSVSNKETVFKQVHPGQREVMYMTSDKHTKVIRYPQKLLKDLQIQQVQTNRNRCGHQARELFKLEVLRYTHTILGTGKMVEKATAADIAVYKCTKQMPCTADVAGQHLHTAAWQLQEE